MWWTSAALAAPVVQVIEAESDWPAEHRAALVDAVATCATRHPWLGLFTVTLGGDEGAKTAEASFDDFPAPPIAECIGPAVSAKPAVKAADGWWSARVEVQPDPAWISAITLVAPPPDAPEGLRRRIALCAAGQAFVGTLVVELSANPDMIDYSYAWPTPQTKAGEALSSCVRGWEPGATPKDVKVVVRVKTAQAPKRAPVKVTADPAVPPPVLEAVRDAVAQCAADHPLTGPFSLGLGNSDGYVNGSVSSMGEGQVMPTMDLGNCVTFGKFPEIPKGGSYAFEVAPGP